MKIRHFASQQHLFRLAAVEMLSVAKKCEEKSEGTEAVQLRNVGVNASGPEKSDRGVGRSRPVTLEFGTITSPVQKADFASDAPLIEYANKVLSSEFL